MALRKLTEVLAVLQTSAPNTAVDKTYDLGNIDRSKPFIVQVCTPPGAGGSLILSDADDGAIFVNIGLGASRQALFMFAPEGEANWGVLATLDANPPGGAPISTSRTNRRPKKLRMQIGALGVGLQSYWEFFGEYLKEIDGNPIPG